MSDGYWRGKLEDASSFQPGEGSAANADFGGEAFRDANLAPDAPAASSNSSNPYWQGMYRLDELADEGEVAVPVEHVSGSVSARARQTYAAEALRQKDHVAAGLLAIFLGVFGVHKFYLGCNQAGFIMLAVSIIGGIFTFGLAAAVIEVISIIEGIIYLMKSQTEFDRLYVLNQRDWF